MDINNVDWDLPLAVNILLRRMRGDPAQRLTYEMSGDGCSTSLHLTWTCLTCPGCQGVRCPGRPRPTPRSRRPTRPRSWAMGGAFSYSSPEDEDGGSLSPLSPVLSSMGESGEEEEEDEEYLTEEQSEVEEDTRKDTRAEEEEEGENSDSSIVTCRRGPPPKHQLTNTGGSTSRGVNILTLRPPPEGQLTDITTSSSEPEEEEQEQNNSNCSPDPDSESDSKYSSCKDSGLCLDDPGPSSNNKAGIGGSEERTQEPLPPEAERPCSRVEHRGVQTEDGGTRLVKRCHAVWAALEQLYVYYDDKEGVLRVSDVDSGQLVVDATRTEATLRYLHGAEGQVLRVVMEIVWMGTRGVESC